MTIKEEFDKNGYVALRGVMQDEFLARLMKQTILLATRIKPEDLHHTGPFETISSIHNLATYSSLYGAFIASTDLRDTAEALLGEPLSDEIFNSSYFAKPAIYGLATKPHQDNAYFHMEPPNVATCWFGLSDSNRENGGLFYYPGSHTLGLLAHEPKGNPGTSQALTPGSLFNIYGGGYKPVDVALKRGDAIIHNALVAHGSHANHSDMGRPAFNFSVAGVSCKRDEVAHAKYREQLKVFLAG